MSCRAYKPKPGEKYPGDKAKDMVNHPPHYTRDDNIECIEAIEAALGEEFSSYLRGSIMKYIWRAPHKNGVEDYQKAQFYLTRLIDLHNQSD